MTNQTHYTFIITKQDLFKFIFRIHFIFSLLLYLKLTFINHHHMNPSLNESFLQGQPDISYSNQTTTPTDTQSLIVSQPDQPAQPTQSASDHVTVPIPHNNYQSQQISGQQGNRSYLDRYILEEVSDYISRDQLGNVRLTADLNKMLGLGRCLFVLAILEIISYGLQVYNESKVMDLFGALISIACIFMPIIFICGYRSLNVGQVWCYYGWRLFVIFLNIFILVVVFIALAKDYNEKIAILLIVYVVQFLFNVFLICFPLLLGLLGLYYREVLFPSEEAISIGYLIIILLIQLVLHVLVTENIKGNECSIC